ncbi:hypothetical protein [Actinomadura sp. 6N118]|uniref:hypothetical protein n=1 Tax=Actinomadura sp. 6N118 TaxID=3375151 RepID=UPI0037A86DAE
MSTMEDLDLDRDQIAELGEQLADDFPVAADLIGALVTFGEATDDLEGLPDEIDDMRRSHVTALLALIMTTSGRVHHILSAFDFDVRLDEEAREVAHQALAQASEALGLLAEAAATRER